jgi:hypothetical protein
MVTWENSVLQKGCQQQQAEAMEKSINLAGKSVDFFTRPACFNPALPLVRAGRETHGRVFAYQGKGSGSERRNPL